MSGRSILITGANGFLGSALTKALLARGDRVRAMVRPGSDESALADVKHCIVHGDVTKPESLPPLLEGVDTVFHLAGIRRGSTRDDFMRVNAEAVRTVGDAMVKAGAKRLVFVGSLAASGPSIGGVPRVEEDAFNPQEWYGESKAEGERIAFSFNGKLEVTSCRPSRIVGPGDHENLTFFKLVKKGFILRIGGPERRLSFVDVDDVVDQLLLQADKPEAVGEAFFSASDETASVEQLMTMARDALGCQARVVTVPPFVLSSVGAIADVVSNATGKKLPVNRKLARQLLVPGWTCSIAKARRVLGYAPKRSLHDAIERSAKSYVELGWL